MTAAPTPKINALISAAPTVRPMLMTIPRAGGKMPSVANAGKSITASRTTKYEPSSSSEDTMQERQREHGRDRGEHRVADAGVGALAR